MIQTTEFIQGYWLPEECSSAVDSHTFFRAVFQLPQACNVRLRIGGGIPFRVWLNGQVLGEGPARYSGFNYTYEQFDRDLAAGEHVVSFHAHHLGIPTRLFAADVKPFVALEVLDAKGQTIPLGWKVQPSLAHRRTRRRLGCVLGWVEWCDTRRLPAAGWQLADFKPAEKWLQAQPVFAQPVAWSKLDLAPMRPIAQPLRCLQSGPLVNMSLIDHDPTSAFVTRELSPNGLPPQGCWYRYDLGRVRLGRIELEVDFPAGTIVQAAYAESLTHGRVSPYVKTGGGEDSCMLDHWVCAGGTQTLTPLQPKGARFIEIHVLGSLEAANLRTIRFWERAYYDETPDGSFECADPLLNRIWQVGVDTLRSCSEDAITDNPHRERGQWLGDVVGPGMDILAAAYRDWRPLRRGLLQAG
jgi:alpha-L-rhamnosidase